MPTPDVNTNPQVMAWMMDTFSMHLGYTVPGVVYVTIEAARKLGMDLAGARVAVQSFGNVGATAALLLAEEGARIVAIADSQGAISVPKHHTLFHRRFFRPQAEIPQAVAACSNWISGTRSTLASPNSFSLRSSSASTLSSTVSAK